nr:TetR/AcrR family transcriptional regulator [Xenorhabdus anantnagensis]
MSLFWEKGFAETSLQELASATGILRGSLYNAYQSKEAFFLRVFEMHKDLLLDQIKHSLDKPGLHESIDNYFNVIIDSMTVGEPARGCLSTKVALSSSVLDTQIREALQGMLDEIEQIFKARLSKSENHAELKVTPEEAAVLLLTFTRGLVVIERVYQDKVKLLSTAKIFMSLLF